MQTDALATIRDQWNKYKEKYLDRAVHEVRYFERAITIPFSLSKRILEEPSFKITEYVSILEIASKREAEEKQEEGILEECCCSRSVEQQCSSSTSLVFPRPSKISKDPYKVLNSLTSQQIRRLISTSYNACFKHYSQEQIETASKKLQFSATLARSFKPEKKKKQTLDQLVQRLRQPTQATLMRKAKEVSTRNL